MLQTLRLLRIEETNAEIVGSLELGANEQVGRVAVDDDRLFVELSTSGWVA